MKATSVLAQHPLVRLLGIHAMALLLDYYSTSLFQLLLVLLVILVCLLDNKESFKSWKSAMPAWSSNMLLDMKQVVLGHWKWLQDRVFSFLVHNEQVQRIAYRLVQYKIVGLHLLYWWYETHSNNNGLLVATFVAILWIIVPWILFESYSFSLQKNEDTNTHDDDPWASSIQVSSEPRQEEDQSDQNQPNHKNCLLLSPVMESPRGSKKAVSHEFPILLESSSSGDTPIPTSSDAAKMIEVDAMSSNESSLLVEPSQQPTLLSPPQEDRIDASNDDDKCGTDSSQDSKSIESDLMVEPSQARTLAVVASTSDHSSSSTTTNGNDEASSHNNNAAFQARPISECLHASISSLLSQQSSIIDERASHMPNHLAFYSNNNNTISKQGWYSGSLNKAGKMHGNGVFWFPDGSVYIGTFSDGHLEGIGALSISPPKKKEHDAPAPGNRIYRGVFHDNVLVEKAKGKKKK